MSLDLHLRYQCFETTMGFVDITCQIRKIRVQVHFRTGKPSVAPVATDLKQLHPAFFEFSEHQVSHLVGSQLGKMQGITNTVENVLHRPFAERLAWVSLRIGEENGAVPVSTVAPDESSTIFFDIFFKPDKGWVRENDGSWHVVLRGLSSNGDGMGSPIDIIKAQLDNLLTAQRPIMGEQHNDLIAKRAARQHIFQDGFHCLSSGIQGTEVGTGTRPRSRPRMPSRTGLRVSRR